MDSSKNISASHKSGTPMTFKKSSGGPSLKAYKVTSCMPLTTDHELRVANPGEAEAKKTFKK